MSSSSSLVCSAVVAVFSLLGCGFSKVCCALSKAAAIQRMHTHVYVAFLLCQKEVAEFACSCERHVGTQSGGMDQVLKARLPGLDLLNVDLLYFTTL